MRRIRFESAGVAGMVLVGTVFWTWGAQPGAEPDALEGGVSGAERARAEVLIRAAGFPGGVFVHLGATNGALMGAVAGGGRFIAQGLVSDRGAVESIRDEIHRASLSGAVSVDLGTSSVLPYADHLVNILAVEEAAGGAGLLDPIEAFRVLAPLGVLAIRGRTDPANPGRLKAAGFTDMKTAGEWTLAVRPRPAGMDEWTHAKYGPEGTGTSRDKVTGPPRSLRWVYAPEINQSHGGGGSSIHAAVTANGRLYQVLNHAPPFLAVEADHRLTARDAFNGVILWEKPVKVRGIQGSGGTSRNYGLQKPGRAVAVAGDTLYTLLDSDGNLVALDGRTGSLIREYKGLSPDATIILGDKLLLLCRNMVRMVNERTGAELWKAEVGGYDNELFYGEGRVFCRISRGAKLVCLDAGSGAELWVLKEQTAVIQGYIGGTLVALKGSQLIGFAAKDGSQKWTHTYNKSGRAGAVWPARFSRGMVWVYDVGSSGDGEGASPSGAQPAGWVALDPDTGKVMRRFPASFADKCAPPRSTDRYLIPARLVFTDTESGENIHPGTARGACAFGALPANGMLYTFPTDCRCRYYLNGTMGFGSESGLPSVPAGLADRLEPGPAFKAMSGPAAEAGDWPVYRADAERRGFVECRLPADPARVWAVALGGPLSPPIVAAGRVFVAAVDRHQIHALDAKDGRRLWSFTAGGRITAPPTYSQGALVFGSRDGWVYCVRAGDGKLAWRFLSAPASRKIVVQGQLESAWPIEGSVLAIGGRVYGTAGRHSGLGGGISVFALELADGRVVWETQPVNATFADMLVREGEWLFMQRSQFGLTDGKPPASRYHKIGNPVFGAGAISSFRQNSYTPRAQWSLGGFGRSPVFSFDSERAIGLQLFEDDKYAIFKPAETGCKLWLKRRGQGQAVGQTVWEVRTPIQPQGMLLTPDQAVVAGPDDVWPRKGSKLLVYSAADGSLLHTGELEASPVFDGLVGAHDRLYMADQAGRLTCWGPAQ